MTVQSRYCVMTGPTLHGNNGSVMISEVRKVKVENTDMVMIVNKNVMLLQHMLCCLYAAAGPAGDMKTMRTV